MGMIGNYTRVSQSELDDYLKESKKLEDRVYGEGTDEDTNMMDVEKAWDGIFFLLTGKSTAKIEEALPPLAWLLNAPQQIDPDQDMGYGPALYTTIDQTREVSAVLNSISEEELKARYNGKQMMEQQVYPQIWDDNDAVDYLVEYFNSLKSFYAVASAENQAMIIFIN